MDVELSTEPTRLVAVHRRTIAMGEIRDFYDHAYAAVVAALARQGSAPDGPGIGWYHGMPAETCTISAGFPVVGIPAGELSDEVAVVDLPGGRALIAVHEGSYDALAASWQTVMAELGNRGVSPRGDFWEEYLTDPMTVRDPIELRTRLVLPLA